MHRPLATVVLLAALVVAGGSPALGYDLDATPGVPEGFKATLFAREPDLMHPAALAFDKRGRLFVGGGPQFRRPSPDTPPDSIRIVVDDDGDGVAERFKTFATGFNCVQALAWKGDELWVANCPDVTVVRDTDGDDVADEYRLVFTGLGHLRHGLHGFSFGPDGRLYMTQGNSRAQKHAPLPFRELMHVDSDEPDNQPINKVYSPDEYQRSYIGSWPSSEGGVLRCDPDGRNLEIYSRGYRNPWDAAFDDQFVWLATDNDDGPESDRIIRPFYGSHFGKVHPWSYSWTGEDNPPTVPMSGLFPSSNGSGVGVVFYTANQFPPQYRNTFLIGDWTRKAVYVLRRKWDGAHLTHDGELGVLADEGDDALFRPTDLAVGPDGALYVAGWGKQYGSKHAPYSGGDKNAQTNEGRVFRIWYERAPLVGWDGPKRAKPQAAWGIGELVADLGHQVEVFRVDAQDELVRRGASATINAWEAVRNDDRATTAQRTWALWAMARALPEGESATARFVALSGADGNAFNTRLQAVRILGDRREIGAAPAVAALLDDSNPRIRFAAAQALRRMGAADQADALLAAAAGETDRLAFYVQWRTLGELLPLDRLTALLNDSRAGVRRAALLALLEADALPAEAVLPLTIDPDPATARVASLFLSKSGKRELRALSITPNGGEFRDPLQVELASPIPNVTIRYSTDGNEPTPDSPAYDKPIAVADDVVLRAALFRGEHRVGAAVPAVFDRLTEEEWRRRLLIQNVRTREGHAYRLVAGGLREGALLFNDRDYVYKDVPDALHGATYIRTSNDHAEAAGPGNGDAWLTFDVNHDVVVMVAHDERAGDKPAWMRVGEAGGFEDTDHVLDSTDVPFRLYAKPFKAGTVALGGNGDGKSMYQVVVQKQGQPAARPKTTLAQTLPLVRQASPKRGKELFFREVKAGGVGCYLCHKLDDRGTAVGPDLSDLGLRADALLAAESILDPNAKLIEGYLQAVVQTKAGEQYFGMIREESAKALSLYQANGELVTLAKSDIAERRLLDLSAMPANFGTLLSPQQVADMVAYLLTQRKPKAETGIPASGD